jgi:hypothetical protein
MLSPYTATIHEKDDEPDEKGDKEDDKADTSSAGVDLKEMKTRTVLLIVVCSEGHSWSLGMLTLQRATLTFAHVED